MSSSAFLRSPMPRRSGSWLGIPMSSPWPGSSWTLTHGRTRFDAPGRLDVGRFEPLGSGPNTVASLNLQFVARLCKMMLLCELWPTSFSCEGRLVHRAKHGCGWPQDDQHFILIPLLVTGVKLWHLRPYSQEIVVMQATGLSFGVLEWALRPLDIASIYAYTHIHTAYLYIHTFIYIDTYSICIYICTVYTVYDIL